MKRIARTIACSAAFAGAAFAATPAQAATTPVSATPSVSYVADGTTVQFAFDLNGTQHHATDPSGATLTNPGVISMNVDFGDGKGQTGGDAGAVSCSTKGSSPLKNSMPATYTYAKPGTYTVKLDFWYCGDANNSHVTKSVDVVVPAKSAPAGQSPIKTSMSTDLLHEVKGRTLTYDYVAEGIQRFVAEGGGTPYANGEPTGYSIDFGDGTQDAGNGTGGATCTKVGADSVYMFLQNKQHVYAKPGTYTVTTKTSYCADTGQKTVTKSYVVKVGKGGATTGSGSTGTGSTGTGSTGHTATPAPAGHPGTGTKPTHTATMPSSASTAGPKVETDQVTAGPNDSVLYAGGALFAAIAAGGTLVARRQR